MSEHEKTYINNIAQHLADQRDEVIGKTSTKEDLFDLMLYKIMHYSVGE